MQESYEKGVAIRSASSFASGAARYLAKRKQRHRRAGYRASKNCNQDADAVDLAEGNMPEGASASRRSVLRSHKPQTRLEASCTRTGRPPGRLGPNWVETGPRRRKPHGRYERSGGVGPRNRTETGSRPVREGESRTADMNVLEESDHATVPMKLLNKEGQPSAEAVEGRAWPKENIARSDTFPTQRGRTRVPRVGRCAAGSWPPTSEGGAVCANERSYGSVRGVPGDRYPYRDRFKSAT